MVFNNYRPVSLLCILSKVFEKVMYSRLSSFLERNKILLNNQFGFRKHHSAYMALMILLDKIVKALENVDYVIGIYLDFSKAFDTVDHGTLLLKLEHNGVRGSALKWFKSYLSDRQQYVTYNGVSSLLKNINCGVPQGSMLGPLLFLLYITDLSNVCKCKYKKRSQCRHTYDIVDYYAINMYPNLFPHQPTNQMLRIYFHELSMTINFHFNGRCSNCATCISRFHKCSGAGSYTDH